MSRNISERARFHPTAKDARRKPPRSVGFPARKIVNLPNCPPLSTRQSPIPLYVPAQVKHCIISLSLIAKSAIKI